MHRLSLLFLMSLAFSGSFSQQPLRLALAGLSHGHVAWIFNRPGKTDVKLVGIYEPDQKLVQQFIKNYQLDPSIFYNNLDQMLAAVHPDAVSAFGPINEHISVVRACGPKGIHVMVEKPLATTLADAREIQRLAEKYYIQVLTNFETSWYASNQYLRSLLEEGKIGRLRKVMVNDGHQGPKEIGVSPEFLAFLTDPVKNGGGALKDFGCYGANLMTWLMKGQQPISVTAVTFQNKPDVYPKVEDEASIILQYPGTQCIIQASWNWTFSRKDMEIYGDKGYAVAVNATTVRQRFQENKPEETLQLAPRPQPYTDPFSVFAAVIQHRIQLEPHDLYSLPVNVTVVEILEAARESARKHSTVFLAHR